MTTLTKHEPVLTYERSYDLNSVPMQRVYLPQPSGRSKMSVDIRKCLGTTCEEIIHTVIDFQQSVENLGLQMSSDKALGLFLSTLTTNPRGVYNEMIRVTPPVLI